MGKNSLVDRPCLVSPLLVCSGYLNNEYQPLVLTACLPLESFRTSDEVHPSFLSVPFRKKAWEMVCLQAEIFTVMGKANLLCSVLYLLVFGPSGEGSMELALWCTSFFQG